MLRCSRRPSSRGFNERYGESASTFSDLLLIDSDAGRLLNVRFDAAQDAWRMDGVGVSDPEQ